MEGPALTEGAIVSSREVSRMRLEAKRLRNWEMRSSSYTEERNPRPSPYSSPQVPFQEHESLPLLQGFVASPQMDLPAGPSKRKESRFNGGSQHRLM